MLGITKGNFAGVGIGEHTIIVMLFPGREALAAQIEARFGNAVTITVGSTPYHCGDGNSTKCPPLQGNSNLPSGLHLTLKLGVATMHTTGSINAQLVVQEDSATPLAMDPGQPLVADIVRPGTRTVVASYGGGIAGTGLFLVSAATSGRSSTSHPKCRSPSRADRIFGGTRLHSIRRAYEHGSRRRLFDNDSTLWNRSS